MAADTKRQFKAVMLSMSSTDAPKAFDAFEPSDPENFRFSIDMQIAYSNDDNARADWFQLIVRSPTSIVGEHSTHGNGCSEHGVLVQPRFSMEETDAFIGSVLSEALGATADDVLSSLRRSFIWEWDCHVEGQQDDR
ncbi:MAG: Imm8 family immunity protein [Pseudomonadota bacterium]